MVDNNWQDEEFFETESGTLRVTAYARDSANNAPWICFQADTDSGFASMTLEQAEAFVQRVGVMVTGMRANSAPVHQGERATGSK